MRDAVTLVRVQKCVAPARPHRKPAPVFTYRGVHSTLPAVAIDAEPYMDDVHELGRLYHEALEFPDPPAGDAQRPAHPERDAEARRVAADATATVRAERP